MMQDAGQRSSGAGKGRIELGWLALGLKGHAQLARPKAPRLFLRRTQSSGLGFKRLRAFAKPLLLASCPPENLPIRGAPVDLLANQPRAGGKRKGSLSSLPFFIRLPLQSVCFRQSGDFGRLPD